MRGERYALEIEKIEGLYLWLMSLNSLAARRDADRHQMSVASHTGLPLGRPKWLEKEWSVRESLP